MSPRVPAGRFTKVIGVMSLMVSLSATADADFYLLFKSCQLAISSLKPIDGGVEISRGDLVNIACKRDGKLLTCGLDFATGDTGNKGNVVEYEVLIDSAPILMFASENGSDKFMVHTVNRVVSMVTHAADIDYFGAKVCRGIYATAIELEQMIGEAPKE